MTTQGQHDYHEGQYVPESGASNMQDVLGFARRGFVREAGFPVSEASARTLRMHASFKSPSTVLAHGLFSPPR